MAYLSRDSLRNTIRQEYGQNCIIVYQDQGEWVTTSSNLPIETGNILTNMANKIMGGFK